MGDSNHSQNTTTIGFEENCDLIDLKESHEKVGEDPQNKNCKNERNGDGMTLTDLMDNGKAHKESDLEIHKAQVGEDPQNKNCKNERNGDGMTLTDLMDNGKAHKESDLEIHKAQATNSEDDAVTLKETHTSATCEEEDKFTEDENSKDGNVVENCAHLYPNLLEEFNVEEKNEFVQLLQKEVSIMNDVHQGSAMPKTLLGFEEITFLETQRQSENVQKKTDDKRNQSKLYPELPINDYIFEKEAVDPERKRDDKSEKIVEQIDHVNLEQEKSNNHEKRSSKSSENEKFYGIPSSIGILLWVFIILVFFVKMYFGNEWVSEEHSFNPVEEFNETIRTMFDLYPETPEATQKILLNAGIEHLKNAHNMTYGSKRISSFLLAAYNDATETLDCIVNRVGNAYTSESFQSIDGKQFSDKISLDKQLKESLRYDQKLVIVKNVHLLSFRTAQLFMSYSDSYDSTPKFPRSVILLTAILPFEFHPETFSRKRDEKRVADYFIKDVWHGKADNDTITPLWSRIGDGLVLIRKSKYTCQKDNKEEL